MQIEFDPEKNTRNIEERNLAFELVEELDWDSAITREDIRYNYNEKRYRVFALLGQRLHVAVVTIREDIVRVISFRKANKREVNKYAKEIKETQKAQPIFN